MAPFSYFQLFNLRPDTIEILSLVVNVINYSNSFANPVVYALRIPELREALALCCLRRPAASNIEMKLSRNEKTFALTPATELRTPRTETGDLQLAFEQEVMETEL